MKITKRTVKSKQQRPTFSVFFCILSGLSLPTETASQCSWFATQAFHAVKESGENVAGKRSDNLLIHLNLSEP